MITTPDPRILLLRHIDQLNVEMGTVLDQRLDYSRVTLGYVSAGAATAVLSWVFWYTTKNLQLAVPMLVFSLISNMLIGGYRLWFGHPRWKAKTDAIRWQQNDAICAYINAEVELADQKANENES